MFLYFFLVKRQSGRNVCIFLVKRQQLCLRFKCLYISGKETIRGKLCLRFKCIYISGKETIRGKLCLRLNVCIFLKRDIQEKAMFKISKSNVCIFLVKRQSGESYV